jgi:hypothetical protein
MLGMAAHATMTPRTREDKASVFIFIGLSSLEKNELADLSGSSQGPFRSIEASLVGVLTGGSPRPGGYCARRSTTATRVADKDQFLNDEKPPDENHSTPTNRESNFASPWRHGGMNQARKADAGDALPVGSNWSNGHLAWDLLR